MKYSNVQWTSRAHILATKILESMRLKDKKYFKQALADEFERTVAIDHQMMNMGDVGRVAKTLNLK